MDISNHPVINVILILSLLPTSRAENVTNVIAARQTESDFTTAATMSQLNSISSKPPVAEEGNILTIVLSSTLPSVATIIGALIGVSCWCNGRCRKNNGHDGKTIDDDHDSNESQQVQILLPENAMQPSRQNSLAVQENESNTLAYKHIEHDNMRVMNFEVKECNIIVVPPPSAVKELEKCIENAAKNFNANRDKSYDLNLNDGRYKTPAERKLNDDVYYDLVD